MKKTILLWVIVILFRVQEPSNAWEDPPCEEISVGVILDVRSSSGKTIESCIAMAVSDFYALNSHYKTRIVLHVRDTNGEPLVALSAALDLLEHYEVRAILGSESTAEAKLLAALGDEATVPILSFSPAPASDDHPYFVQIAPDETAQFHGIAAMAESFQWKNVICIFEDTSNEEAIAAYMADRLEEKGMIISYKSVILTSAGDGRVLEELRKLTAMGTKVFVVHASPSLASRLLLGAKTLGLMGDGYKWVITTKTANFMDFMDGEVIESMQGAVGFKSHIPPSGELRSITSRWRHGSSAIEELHGRGVWAYDAVSALAMAAERTQSGTTLLQRTLETTFRGLGGEFRITNGKVTASVLEVINVIGDGGRKVGFWTTADGFTTEVGKSCSFSNNGLQAIVWPGGRMSVPPKRRMLQTNGTTLRVGVPTANRSGRLFNVSYDPRNESVIVTGFCEHVFRTAFGALHYGLDIEYVLSKGGTYDEFIDQVHNGDFDVGIGDITILANRSLYVDFTLPFTDLGVATLVRDPDTNIWIFLEPLSTSLWILTAVFFLFFGLVIWIIEHRTNKEFQGSTGQQIGTTLWFAFSTLVYAHREKLQSNLSRFVVTVWVFVVLVLTSSYTATLSSVLTVQQINWASKGSYVGYQAGSHVQGLVASNLNLNNGSTRPYSSLEEYAEALTRGSNNLGVDAIIDEIPYIKEFFTKYPSGYSITATQANSNGFGFVFPKGSSLASEMSTQIAKLRQDGTLRMLENEWFNSQSNMTSQDSVPTPRILKIDRFGGLFLISAGSMVLALSIFVLSLVYEHKRVVSTNLTDGKLALIIRYFSPVLANVANRDLRHKEVEPSH